MSPLFRDSDEDAASSRERRLRYRVLLAEYRTVLLIAFVVLFAVGGWLSYGAYADPGERRDQRLESEWAATGSVTHGAVVTEPNEIHPEGTRLEEAPLYYESLTPTVDVEFDGGYDAARADDVTVELDVALVYRAVDPEDGTVYWSRREPLESVAESDVDPDETVTATAAVNVTEVRNSIDEIERDLGASPGETEIVLELERRIDGTIAGEERAATDSYELEIEGDGTTYRVVEPDSYDETREEYATETVGASPGPVRGLGGPALLLAGLIGLGGVGVATLRWPDPTPAEREWLAYRDDRAEFDDVITTARLPASACEGSRAEVESLAALARLGIDLEFAVIYDPGRNRYVVRDGDLRYVFEPPQLPDGDDVLTPVADGDDGETATAAEPTADETTTDALGPADVSESTDGLETASGDEARNAVETSAVDDPSSDAEPESAPTSTSETEPTVEIDDDELLALAALEPADVSEPELFELEADPADDAAQSTDESAASDADGSGSERRADSDS